MCGVFGYIGKEDATEAIVSGLKRLEYRGYDSWGVAVLSSSEINVSRKVGSIGEVSADLKLPKSMIGIGHTRWATHGEVAEENAHPHYSSDKSFVLAQNGIVENYSILRNFLLDKGYKFETQTDTEVIVRLVEEEKKSTDSLREAVRKAFLKLNGRNTIILLTTKGEIIAARNGSPLVIGVDGKDEVYLSSDTLSFSPYAKKMIVVDNGQLVYCKAGDIKIFDISSDKEIEKKIEDIDIEDNKIGKEGFDHFMQKEIHDSPIAIRALISQDLKKYEELGKAINEARNVYSIGSGTAGIAASQIAFYLREYPKIKAISLIGADAIEYYEQFSDGDLIIAPSQSGETADVLEVLEVAKQKGVKIVSLVNMQGSSLSRLSDFKFMSQAGPEVCVMSTKVFVSQLSWGYFISKAAQEKLEEGVENLRELSNKMSKYLGEEKNLEEIKKAAKELIKSENIFLLGKYQNWNIVREGMVKIIEGSYKHAHAIPAGDLKHYAITLMEDGVPVLFAVSEDRAKSDILNAISQVKARGAKVTAVGSVENALYDSFIKVPDTGETSSIMNIIPLQLLAYYMTVELGNNVDKPRNIAKSVTVK